MLLNIALSAGALIVALSRPTGPAAPSAAEQSAANARLCARFRLASAVTHVETNGGGPALASIALTNSAVMLEDAAADPAVDRKHQDAALDLAVAYQDMTAKGSVLTQGAAEGTQLIAQTNAKEQALRDLCEN